MPVGYCLSGPPKVALIIIIGSRKKCAITLLQKEKTALETISRAVSWGFALTLIAGVPKDDVATILAFDGGETCVDFARSDLRVCKGD
jgi:hypothetical protein